MLGINSVPTNGKSSCQNPPMKRLSRSLTMVLGRPCNLKMSLKNSSATCAAVVCGYGKEMCVLCQPINDNKYAILALHYGQSCDEIHRNTFPLPLGNGKRLQQSCWMVRFPLVALADFALLNMLEYVPFEAFPREPLPDGPVGLEKPLMSG